MKKRGISLIVLIITIVVIIILAAVVILSLTRNNPVEKAQEATFKEDLKNIQNELAMYMGSHYDVKKRTSKMTNINMTGEQLAQKS